MNVNKEIKDTDAQLRSSLREYGISRLADTTGLDITGIPTYSCVCPGTNDSIWVYSGKGLTVEEARISAIVESIERRAALWDTNRIVKKTRQKLAGNSVWGPERFTEFIGGVDEAKEYHHWVRGSNLVSGEQVWIPAQLVFLGHPELPYSSFGSSNGLGAGYSSRQAISQALREVMERDAVSCVQLKSSHFASALFLSLSQMASIDVDKWHDRFLDDLDFAYTIIPSTLPEPAHQAYNRYRRAGLNVTIKAIPNDFSVPVFAAGCAEQLSFGVFLANAGYGLDLDPGIAILKALLELAQSRATDLQGAREDCGIAEKARHLRMPKGHWLLTPSNNQLSFRDLEWSTVSSDDEVEILLERLGNCGLNDVAVVEFDAPGGLHVVRVLVPEIETWQATGGESRLGKRMQEHFLIS